MDFLQFPKPPCNLLATRVNAARVLRPYARLSDRALHATVEMICPSHLLGEGWYDAIERGNDNGIRVISEEQLLMAYFGSRCDRAKQEDHTVLVAPGGVGWSVLSASSGRLYTLQNAGTHLQCDCPDGNGSRTMCKHGFAVLLHYGVGCVAELPRVAA